MKTVITILLIFASIIALFGFFDGLLTFTLGNSLQGMIDMGLSIIACSIIVISYDRII